MNNSHSPYVYHHNEEGVPSPDPQITRRLQEVTREVVEASHLDPMKFLRRSRISRKHLQGLISQQGNNLYLAAWGTLVEKAVQAKVLDDPLLSTRLDYQQSTWSIKRGRPKRIIPDWTDKKHAKNPAAHHELTTKKGIASHVDRSTAGRRTQIIVYVQPDAVVSAMKALAKEMDLKPRTLEHRQRQKRLSRKRERELGIRRSRKTGRVIKAAATKEQYKQSLQAAEQQLDTPLDAKQSKQQKRRTVKSARKRGDTRKRIIRARGKRIVIERQPLQHGNNHIAKRTAVKTQTHAPASAATQVQPAKAQPTNTHTTAQPTRTQAKARKAATSTRSQSPDTARTAPTVSGKRTRDAAPTVAQQQEPLTLNFRPKPTPEVSATPPGPLTPMPKYRPPLSATPPGPLTPMPKYRPPLSATPPGPLTPMPKYRPPLSATPPGPLTPMPKYRPPLSATPPGPLTPMPKRTPEAELAKAPPTQEQARQAKQAHHTDHQRDGGRGRSEGRSR